MIQTIRHLANVQEIPNSVANLSYLELKDMRWLNVVSLGDLVDNIFVFLYPLVCGEHSFPD